MALQFIHDNKDNTTGVFIPIEEWQKLKIKYTNLQKEESDAELADWQRNILEDRIADYQKNQTNVDDLDNTINDIEKNL